MKIGIITIHNSPNYGANLQAFALYEYIRSQGNDVELIDLHRPHYDDYVPSKRYISYPDQVKSNTQKVKDVIKNIIKHISRYKANKHDLYNEVSKRKFDAFNSQIKMSRLYRGIDDLYANPPIYDLYITGSDQLWNPTQPFCLEPYFLTFAPKGSQKISYASSIGITELTETEKADYKKWLEKYDAISVRERQAKTLLESFIDKKISCVADPTFLLDVEKWQSMATKPHIDSPYVLLFTLQHTQEMHEYALRISKESGKKLIIINQILPDNLSGDFVAVRDAGLQEWLGYIKHADMVLTNSFHGTVFSIILGAKNFYTYISPTNKRGSRIVDLLGDYNLSSHLLQGDLSKNYNELSSQSINKESIIKAMEIQRTLSREFLKPFIAK